MSSGFLTNEAAIISNPFCIPNIISSLSLSVRRGNCKTRPGILTLFLFVNLPPCITSQTTSLFTISFTFSSIIPSFIKIVVPIFTSS